MLPFLDKKKDLGVIIARLGKRDLDDTRPEVSGPDEEPIDPMLEMAAEEVLRALDDRSPSRLARALKSAFEFCDSQPHEEGPHIEGDEI